MVNNIEINLLNTLKIGKLEYVLYKDFVLCIGYVDM